LLTFCGEIKLCNAVWDVDSGGSKKPCVGWSFGFPRKRGNFGGHPTELFGVSKQRCGRSLSVLQQLVYFSGPHTAVDRAVVDGPAGPAMA